MKKILIMIFTITLTFLTIKPVKADTEIHKAWATAYCLTGTTSTGAQTTAGRTVASKPEWYGYTMYLWLDDGDGIIKPQNYLGCYVVEDTGSEKIRQGKVIDIYMPDLQDCRNFGGRRVLFQIVKAEG